MCASQNRICRGGHVSRRVYGAACAYHTSSDTFVYGKFHMIPIKVEENSYI